jgi:hypothetical protein
MAVDMKTVSDQPTRASERADHILLWPIAIPLVAALLVSVVYAFSVNDGVFAALLGMLIVGAWVVWVVVWLIRSLCLRLWKPTASLVIALLMLCPVVWSCLRASDYIHLALMLPYYDAQILREPNPTAQPILFDWGPGGSHSQRTLIYDPSGRTAKRVGVIEARPDDMETVTVRHLFSHWYVQLEMW